MFGACVCLQVIAAMPNVCNYLHMPAQSGSSSTLQRMRRGYTREAYDALVQRAREVIPNVALSTDMITGVWAAQGTAGYNRKPHPMALQSMPVRSTLFWNIQLLQGWLGKLFRWSCCCAGPPPC